MDGLPTKNPLAMHTSAPPHDKPIILSPDETSLTGQWKEVNGAVIADETCQRIEALIEHHLVKLANSSDGWATLYQDPNDSRLWERTYSQSQLHGGGPPSLTCISVSDAQTRYGGWPNEEGIAEAYVTIHGDSWKKEDIEESVEWAKGEEWKNEIWSGNESWDHDHCQICWWKLYKSDDTEHGVGYRSKKDNWLCTECYEQLIKLKP